MTDPAEDKVRSYDEGPDQLLNLVLDKVHLAAEAVWYQDGRDGWLVATEPGLLRVWWPDRFSETVPKVETQLRSWRTVRDPEVTTRVVESEDERRALEVRFLIQSPRLDVTVLGERRAAPLLNFAYAVLRRYNVVANG